MDIKNGGSAFPQDERNGLLAAKGLTKREWFAGMALIGILQNSKEMNIEDAKKAAAVLSYRVADEMLEAGKGEGNG